MSNIKISVSLNMLPVPTEKSKYPQPPSAEEQIREALELINTGCESYVEWKMVNKAYKQLLSLPRTSKNQNLINMIEPVLAKFGYHKVSAEK